MHSEKPGVKTSGFRVPHACGYAQNLTPVGVRLSASRFVGGNIRNPLRMEERIEDGGLRIEDGGLKMED